MNENKAILSTLYLLLHPVPEPGTRFDPRASEHYLGSGIVGLLPFRIRRSVGGYCQARNVIGF
jgi:hypothetical protein